MYSIGRMIETMATPAKRAGFEFEVAQQCARDSGRTYDSFAPIVPWEVLATRSMIVGTATSGGYLVGTDVADPVDVLAAWSVVMRAGCTRLPGLTSSVVIPRAVTTPDITWLETEASQASVSEPTVGAVNLSPKNVAGVAKFSRSMRLQAKGLEPFVRNVLTRAIGEAIDAGAIAGDGTAGTLTGVINTADVNTQSGTSFDWLAAVTMLQEVAEANAVDDRISYIASPAVRALLQQRECGTAGAGLLWSGNTIGGKAAYVSSSIGTDTMICADWSQLIVGYFGPGVELSIDPYSSFQSSITAVRAIASVDVGLLSPAAFCVGTGIS